MRPGQLAFLLAAQLVARGDKATLKKLLSTLAPNQAGALKTAWERQQTDVPKLLAALRLPPVHKWPIPRNLDDALVPLSPVQVRLHDAPVVQRAKLKNERVAFRVAGNRRYPGLGLGVAAGFLAACYGNLAAAFWPLVLGMALVGWLLGQRFLAPTCSSCSRGVQGDATRCPICSVALVGDIAEINERFDAEERHASGHGSARECNLSGIRCPVCLWIPASTDRWVCSCGQRWNTFETQGRCAGCGKQWQETACLSCKRRSPHASWYAAQKPDTPAGASAKV